MSNEAINFGAVPVATSSTFLVPGVYSLTPTEARLERGGKSPYLEITFTGKEGSMKDKFYLSPKALERIQYLHNSLYGKPLEKPFTTYEEVAAYFDRAFKGKTVTTRVLVGGEESNGRVYTRLGYSGFIIGDDETTYKKDKDGPFSPEDPLYGINVRKSAATPATNTDTVHMNNLPDASSAPQADDLPF